MPRGMATASVCCVALTALAGCMVGPDYVRPETSVPASFKEADNGWKVAQPADALPRGDWWRVFDDPTLAALIERVDVSNQNLAAAEASWRQARALVDYARAGLFPTVSANASRTRSSNGGGSTAASSYYGGSSSSVRNSYTANLAASWELDVWGSVRRGTAAQRASAESAAAQVANARLSAQTTLAQTYFQLRAADALQALLDDTVAAYRQSLTLTQNRYAQGVVGRADVIQAQTQLQSAEAAALDNQSTRATYEHAIAVLVGTNPSTFSLAAAPLDAEPPSIPAVLPSTLLERRPDVAVAERRAAAANEQIGVAQAAFFPTLTLDAQGGFQSSTFSNWLTAPARFWSLGPSLAATLFDAGARRAQVEANRADYDNQVALYKQAVLEAFQDVEDQLATLRVLAREATIRRAAVESATQALAIVNNSYKAGTVTFLDVLTAQNTLFSSRQSLVETMGRRMVASAGLVKALGGGWDGDVSHVTSPASPASSASAAGAPAADAATGPVAEPVTESVTESVTAPAASAAPVAGRAG
ncbi:efflux transporter outer membrane subunit [Chitinasiproducens palmae]|nr:efflux transporter outer membrane subunit [Chitinasiproducens palmae]